ncbi:MAG TPA: fumarylacetoacetate hydrolase family protein [Methylomirabilota bacterium]|nr:fumarylacetoacetate hydrolase family protein [Methylomirabilota bacterium]
MSISLPHALGRGGAIVGYTAGNDLSAWDIERENPLFLPQVFDGCFALGPVILTASEIAGLPALDLTRTILRGGQPRYQGRVNTREMKRPCDELVG